MIKDKDTIEKVNKFLELIQAESLTPRQVDQFINAVLSFVKKTKDDFESLSKENIDSLKRGLVYIAKEHEKVLAEVSSESNSIKTEANKRFKEIYDLLDEVRHIEVHDGKDADEDAIVEKIMKMLPKHEPMMKLTAEDLRDLLSTLVGDERFSAKYIKDLPEGKEKGRGFGGIPKFLSKLLDVELTNLANGEVLVWDSTLQKWVNDTAAGGSGITRTIITTSGNVTLAAAASTDYVYKVAGAHAITLPTAVGNTNRYTVKNMHSAGITIATTSAQTIDDAAAPITVGSQSSVDIISDNANWYII